MTVSSELREKILKRDRGICFMRRLDVVARFGPHRCNSRITLDHVWRFPGGVRGKRAVCLDPDCPNYRNDCEHVMVAMCWHENDKNPSADIRDMEREYLDSLYGPAPLPPWWNAGPS